MAITEEGPLIPFARVRCFCLHTKAMHERGEGKCDNCNCSKFSLSRSLTAQEAAELELKELKGAMCVVPTEAPTPSQTISSEVADDKDRGSAKSLRTDLLEEANQLVTGDRNNSYGEPHQDFARSAGALTALGYRGPDGRELQAHDIAIIISTVKMSRLMWSPLKRDSWVDIAGYAACGYEAAVKTIGSEEKESG